MKYSNQNIFNILGLVVLIFFLIELCSCEKQSQEIVLQSIYNEKSALNFPLESLVVDFIKKKQMPWDELNSIQGVYWNDTRPTSESLSPVKNKVFSRNGYLLLRGFKNNLIPNGKTGVEADVVNKNEGWAGVNVYGSEFTANELTIFKYYPNKNYRHILLNQFYEKVQILKLASQCNDEIFGYSNIEFYEISMTEGRIYVEAYTDEEGGKNSPGSTTIKFYVNSPLDEIDKFKCKSRVKL